MHTDQDRLKQVVINLLSNAYKYTKQGHITLRADSHSSGLLRISVADSGIGIKQEDQHNLFSLFSRLSEGRILDKNGIGLGLTICRTIVEQFGG